jgi:hypothetical protein
MVVHDVAYRSKNSGGSRGLPRFWFLVENKALDLVEVVEFKALTEPATANWSRQADTHARVGEAMAAFWNGFSDPRFGSVRLAGIDFWMRPMDPDWLRLNDWLDGSTESADERVKRLSQALAHRIGLLHGVQLSVTAQLVFRRHAKKLANGMMEASEAYDRWRSVSRRLDR